MASDAGGTIARQIIHQGLDQGAPISLRTVDSGQVVRSALAFSDGVLGADRAPAGRDGLPDGGPTTIEQEYLRVLVLQLMNSGNITPRHLQWVLRSIGAVVRPLRALNIESSTVTSFYVDLASRTGLKRRGRSRSKAGSSSSTRVPCTRYSGQNIVVLDQKIGATRCPSVPRAGPSS
jgi:hypothetical protein